MSAYNRKTVLIRIHRHTPYIDQLIWKYDLFVSLIVTLLEPEQSCALCFNLAASPESVLLSGHLQLEVRHQPATHCISIHLISKTHQILQKKNSSDGLCN